MSSDSLKTHSEFDSAGMRGVYDDTVAQGYVAQYAPYGEIWDSQSSAEALSAGLSQPSGF